MSQLRSVGCSFSETLTFLGSDAPDVFIWGGGFFVFTPLKSPSGMRKFGFSTVKRLIMDQTQPEINGDLRTAAS